MAHQSWSRKYHRLTHSPKFRPHWRLGKLLFLLAPVFLPRLWIEYRDWENTWLQPQAIFILGGETGREKFGAKFAQHHPSLPVWISGGAPQGYAKRVFIKAGNNPQNLHLDYQASDTVTNFTTLVDRFQSAGINTVYLVTSDDHMPRARAIGEIIFGSRGIKIKPVCFISGRPVEPFTKTVRDSARSILWLTTGYTGASVLQVHTTNAIGKSRSR
jgi:uncharacterized SAM-binding protein YcdF (DUF218 family)